MTSPFRESIDPEKEDAAAWGRLEAIRIKEEEKTKREVEKTKRTEAWMGFLSLDAILFVIILTALTTAVVGGTIAIMFAHSHLYPGK